MKRYAISLIAGFLLLMCHGTAQGSFWSVRIGDSASDYALSVQQTAEGGFIVAGNKSSFGGGGYYDAWALKLNADGSVAWQKTYGGTSDDHAYSVQRTADGGYIVAGQTWHGVHPGGKWENILEEETND